MHILEFNSKLSRGCLSKCLCWPWLANLNIENNFSSSNFQTEMFGAGEKIRLVTQQIIVKSNFRPKGISSLNGSSSETSDGPTTVFVNLFVRSFEKIDDVKMEFSVQITFRQQWNDNR